MSTHEALAIRSGSDASTVSAASSKSTSTARPRTRHLSLEYYYNRLIGFSHQQSDASDHPPSYDVATQPQALRSKAQPREDEGKEQLPGYSCSIMTLAVFSKKMELERAVNRAPDRNWSRVFVELRGTALRIYKTKSVGVFSKAQLAANISPDLPPYVKPGLLLRTYSLQYADVGIAADYTKRRYVIRIRAEMDQFLLSCIEIETFLQWLESLSAAIDLAPPLEERKLPRDTSMPRTQRRTIEPWQDELEVNPNLVRQQQEIMRMQYPQQLAFDDPQEEDQEGMPEEDTAAESVIAQSPVIPASTSGGAASSSLRSRLTPPASSSSPDDILPVPLRQAPAHINPVSSQVWGPPVRIAVPESVQRSLTVNPAAASLNRNPSITENGKWRPQHAWSPMYDMLYAKRCMSVLLANSPRKTNVVIMKGKKWIIDWTTGALTRLQPPDYGEVNVVGPWGSAMGGAYGRV